MSKKTETKKCALCGKKFEPKNSRQTYCTQRCKRDAENAARRKKRDAKPAGKKCKKPAKNLTEKVKLPKKGEFHPTTAVGVHGMTDPFKIIALSLGVMIDAFMTAVDAGLIRAEVFSCLKNKD